MTNERLEGARSGPWTRFARSLPAYTLDVVWATVLAAITVLCVAYFAPRGFNGGFVDMAHDGYQLRQALDLYAGGMLFRDTFDQYGPLTPYLNLVGFATLGTRLLAIKYFMALWYGLTAAAMFVLARQFLGRTLSVVAVVVWLLSAPFYQHGVMISPHAYALLFQAVALIWVLRDGGRGQPSPRLWAVGALCGVCWLLKQSLGSLFLIALIGFVATIAALDRSSWRLLLIRLGRMAAGFAAVVLPVLVWLAWQGALDDWYRQTILFPRVFYLGIAGSSGWSLPAAMGAFLEAQWSAEVFWLILRAIVIGGAFVTVVRSRVADAGLLLAGWVTALLWLAAFPSGNYMHQWWTVSPTMCVALYVIHRTFEHTLGTQTPWARFRAQAATVGVIAVLAWGPVEARVRDASARHTVLSEKLLEPWSLRGIRTDVRTGEALATLYELARDYRARHPGTPIVSIDSSDGYRTGVAQSLPVLSFFEDNPHPLPVYWSLPALSTSVYPEYAETMSAFIRERAPLIVDFRLPYRAPRNVLGYRVLASVPLPAGHLSLYEPDRGVSAHASNAPVLEWIPDERELFVAGSSLAARPPPSDAAGSLARWWPLPLAGSSTVREPLSALYEDVPHSQRLFGTIQKYQLHWSDVAEAERFAVNQEAARVLVDDFLMLVGAGVPDALVLDRMADRINVLVASTLSLGAALPDEVEPIIRALILARGLRDSEGLIIPDRETLDRLVEEARFRPRDASRYIVDPETGFGHRVTVYAWPAGDWLPESAPALEPVLPDALGVTAGIVTVEGSQWRARGPVDGAMSYLLQVKPRSLRKGARFVATGALREGGLTVGLLRDNAWTGFVNITRPGWFVAALTVPEDGEYELVIANNVAAAASRWWRVFRGTGLGRWLPSVNPRNDFRIHASGWVAPSQTDHAPERAMDASAPQGRR